MPHITGQMVNARYRIIRLLGQGGFGAVYQAWDINLDRPCALKENLDTSEKTRRQFEREARILANLSHPNLPRVTDHFVIPDQGQYLVMDFVDGEDLEERLRRVERPLDETEALDWIGQVCEALNYLHRHDPPIIHRDIKPANIRITPQGRAMLVDFGIAKMLNPQIRTTAGARAITPGYSPPEQYGQGPTDERSDIFSVGATLYTLLTGRVPPDSVDAMAGIVPAAPPVERVNARVSLQVSQVVRQAMNFSRSERYQNIHAFTKALQGEQDARVKATVVVNAPDKRAADPRVEVSRDIRANVEIPAKPVLPQSAPANSVVIPVRQPPSRPNRTKPVLSLAFMGLGGFGLALLGGVAGIWLVYQILKPAASPTPTMIASGGEPLGTLQTETLTPSDTPEPTPTSTPVPTDTPSLPPQTGAVLAVLPQARIAFVSDHGGDGKDQIYYTEVTAGEFWMSPLDVSGLFQADPANAISPISNLLVQIPIGGGHNMAWWPDWCDRNSVLVYEAQDTHDSTFQAIYQVDTGQEGPGEPQLITWDGFSKIGVPRCANLSRRAAASALSTDGASNWRLFSFDLDHPTEPELIGNGFAFSGFVSWAVDDRWIALMHKEGSQPYALYRMDWDRPGEFSSIPSPQGMTITRFPAISPSDGTIAYACSDNDKWGLCLQQLDGNGFTHLLKNLGPINLPARGQKPAISGITPSWSPDGKWLAYAGYNDGDWDIYLYNLELKITLNITDRLGGDQFHPVWSKP